MRKDYINYNGKQYRVECNWNALIAYLESVGKNTMADLAKIDQIPPSDLTPLMAACVNEGERMDGHDCNLSAKEIGENVTTEEILDFFKVYAAQTCSLAKKKSEKTETEKPTMP